MEYFNLTTPQLNIWNLQRYYGDTAISNLCGVVFYPTKRDVELLRKAINHVIRNQTALRLRFLVENNQPGQYVKEYSYVNIPIHNFSDMDAFEGYVADFASTPIGLLECDMHRFEVVQVGDTQGILVVLSHLVADAWSFSLLAKAVEEAYRRLADGAEEEDDIADYREYVASEEKYFTSNRYEKDGNFWQEKYQTRPETTQIKPGSSKNASVAAKRLIRKLPVNLARQIQKYCAENPVTPAVFFETALFTYLSKINTDNATITVGLPVLNRTRAQDKRTMGMFISTIPLTVEISEEDSCKQLMHKITDAHAQTFRHQKYPYSLILRKLREKQGFEGNLYDVMFSYQNAQTDTNSTTKWYSSGYSEVPFALHVDNRDNGDTYT